MPNISSSIRKPYIFCLFLCFFCAGVGFTRNLLAQNEKESDPKSGYQASVPNPLDATSATQLMQDLTELANSVPADKRTTVLLNFQGDSGLPGKTTFEDALKVARGITSPELRRLKIVTYLDGEITGHGVLPIIASEALLTTSEAVIGNAVAGETLADPTILLAYESIAKRRGLFPTSIVAALADPGLELAEITRVGGEQEYVTTKALNQLRKEGRILKENIISPAGIPLELDAQQLRSARVSAGIVDSVEQGLELLDHVADLNGLDGRGPERKHDFGGLVLQTRTASENRRSKCHRGSKRRRRADRIGLQAPADVPGQYHRWTWCLRD
ncbi:MAG: hypothetical protein ACPHF4_14090, partial [Rubripirellula sp.]